MSGDANAIASRSSDETFNEVGRIAATCASWESPCLQQLGAESLAAAAKVPV